MKSCCEIMEAQLNYQCDQHPDNDCPDIVIRYSEDYERYSLHSPNAEYCCNFCPWCGVKLKGAKVD